VSTAADAVLEPIAFHRDVVALAMMRAGEVLTDPRVRALDLAGMVAASARIEGHVANVSAALDTILSSAVSVLVDPRVHGVDWAGHVANVSATMAWASDTNLGQKIETGIEELDDLMLRLVHAATAMSAFGAPPPAST
jgi:hypothetical protein